MKTQDKVYWPLAAALITVHISAPYVYNGGNPLANDLYSVGMFSFIAWCTLRYRWNDWQPSLDLLDAKQDEEGHHVLTCRYESRMEKWEEMVGDVGACLVTIAVVAALVLLDWMLWAVLLMLIGFALSPLWPRMKPWAIWLRARARYAGERAWKWYCNVRQK